MGEHSNGETIHAGYGWVRMLRTVVRKRWGRDVTPRSHFGQDCKNIPFLNPLEFKDGIILILQAGYIHMRMTFTNGRS